MIPARYSPVLFGFILSGLMSCMVSCISWLRVLEPIEGMFGAWMTS